MPESKLLSPEQWSNYWDKALITTLGGMFQQNYDGAIFEFWRSQLAGTSGHIVDLACGNGALVWIANDIINDSAEACRVTGVDISRIDPFAVLNRDPADYPGVEFVGETSIEQLPFDDSSIDVVISQYGLEYSNTSKTIPEAARVLKPGGRMSYIIHNVNSSIYKDSTKIVSEYKFAFNAWPVHDLFLELDRLYRKYPKYDRVVRSHRVVSKRRDIEGQVAQIQVVVKRLNSPQASAVMTEYLNAMFTAFSKKSFKARVDRRQIVLAARDSMADFIRRIEDLAAAALSQEQFEQLLETIKGEGFELQTFREIAYGVSENMGTALVAQKM